MGSLPCSAGMKACGLGRHRRLGERQLFALRDDNALLALGASTLVMLDHLRHTDSLQAAWRLAMHEQAQVSGRAGVESGG